MYSAFKLSLLHQNTSIRSDFHTRRQKNTVTGQFRDADNSSKNKRKCMNIPFHRSTALDAHA